jgi:hypothetical protein
MHSASTILLGSNRSSSKDLTEYNSDPATYLAGLCVRQASTAQTLSLTSGRYVGVSMGRSLSDHKKTSVLRSGLQVPVRASLKRSTGVITIDTFANLVSGTEDIITVGATGFTAQSGAATPEEATFQAATDNATTATSLAVQINAHPVASTLVYAVAASNVVTLYSIVEGAATGHDVALSYTDGDAQVGATLSGLSGGKLTGGSNTISDIAYATIGSKMYINNTTGKADIAMTGYSTVSDATYLQIELTGVDEDAANVAAVVVNMPGGL